MKKPFLITLVVCICFFSCKKDKRNSTASAKEKHALNFDLSDFTHTVVPLTNNAGKLQVAATSTPPAAKLVYLLFDAGGKIFSEQTQHSTDSNFGTVRDSVPDGNYTAIFVAGTNDLIVAASYGLTYSYIKYPSIRYHDDEVYWYDSFYKKIDITVTGGVITRTVSLDRIVAQLELNIEDAIPTNVKTIQLTFAEAPALSLENLERHFDGNQNLLSTVTSRAANFKIDTYTLHNNDLFPVTINALNSAGAIIYTKTVRDVKCVTNKKTILSGKLFTDPGNFTITAEAEVTNPDINVTF